MLDTSADYSINKQPGFTFSQFVKGMKSLYDTPQAFIRDNPRQDPEIGEFLAEHWDEIKEFTFAEAMGELNMEKRRVMFSCVGAEKIFNGVQSKELVSSVTLKKKQTRWDTNNKPYEVTFDDTYKLYRISKSDVGITSTWRETAYMYVVQCWCPSTAREYWIQIDPSHITLSGPELIERRKNGIKGDAIDAICSTFRTRRKNPKALYRHGDVLIVQKWGDERDDELYDEPRAITREQYLNLMVSEA